MKVKSLAVFLSAALLAAGCSSAADDSKSETSSTLTISNYGRQTVIQDVPEKVLSFGPNCTELLAALNVQDRIVGTTLSNHSRGPLPEYKEKVESLPMLNYGSATREAVLSSGADFIYGIDWEFGDEGISFRDLEEFGIAAYVNSAQTIEEEYKEIDDLGDIFQVQETAAALIEDQTSRIEAVEEKAEDLDPVRVLVYDSGSNGIFTASGSNFETRLIEKAGGENIFSDLTDKAWTTVSAEEAVRRNPDVIVVHDYDSPSLEEKIRDIKNDPALSQLDAVKNDRFVAVSLESVLPGIRMADTVETFFRAFYPDHS